MENQPLPASIESKSAPTESGSTPTRERIKKESGYSEEEQAKIVEGYNTDIKQLKKRKPLPANNVHKQKIISTYKANLEKILKLVETLSELEGKFVRQEEQIVEEIKSLRHIQEELLNALILEQKGALTKESISENVWGLIE